MTTDADSASGFVVRLRQATFVCLIIMIAAVQFSIAVAQIFLALTATAWAATLLIERRRPSAPPWVAALLCFAGWTLVSAAFSADARAGFADSKQLVLLILVPITYDVVDEERALPVTTLL